jgi:hypothetical protein
MDICDERRLQVPIDSFPLFYFSHHLFVRRQQSVLVGGLHRADIKARDPRLAGRCRPTLDRITSPFAPCRMITLDHANCEIGRDQTCKWGTEWDSCAPIDHAANFP